VRSALQHKGIPGSELIVVDTVDRIQGQEREVVVISLATGDPDQTRSRNGAFHLSENRLNVAISRARTKVVLVASSHAFAALPSDVLGLRAASKSRDLRDRLVAFDYTALYCAAKA
jgi:superfamily I DNA and/or RNA helicase